MTRRKRDSCRRCITGPANDYQPPLTDHRPDRFRPSRERRRKPADLSGLWLKGDFTRSGSGLGFDQPGGAHW